MNSRIFTQNSYPSYVIIKKIIYIFFLWVSAAPETKKAKREDTTYIVKMNLKFLGPRTNGASDPKELKTSQSEGSSEDKWSN